MARLALIKDRTAAKNREKSLTNPLLKKHNSDRLRQIEHQIRAVDEAIMDLIAEDRPLKARFDILVSIPGVSQVTAFTLIIEMPELGELDEKPRSAVLPHEPPVRTMDRTRVHCWGHRPPRTLHASSCRMPLQPGPQGQIRSAQSRRKTTEGRDNRNHAKTRRARKRLAPEKAWQPKAA